MNFMPPPEKKRFPPYRSVLGRRALQGLMAACIGTAGMILWSHRDAARQVTMEREPQLNLISSPAAASPVSAQTRPSAFHASTIAVPPQSAPSAPAAQTPLAGSAPPAAGQSSEQEQLAQLLRGFLAVVEQDIEELKSGIEQLKTNQEQIARDNSTLREELKAVQERMISDNAAVAEQLKATQEQMARLIAKDSEQQQRPKTSASSPRPVTISAAKPAPKLSSPQTRAQPLAPVRTRPE
jgi:regulator of replication initiation timing